MYKMTKAQMPLCCKIYLEVSIEDKMVQRNEFMNTIMLILFLAIIRGTVTKLCQCVQRSHITTIEYADNAKWFSERTSGNFLLQFRNLDLGLVLLLIVYRAKEYCSIDFVRFIRFYCFNGDVLLCIRCRVAPF